MRKLKLELDELRVDSFDTERRPQVTRGTVRAAHETYVPLTIFLLPTNGTCYVAETCTCYWECTGGADLCTADCPTNSCP